MKKSLMFESEYVKEMNMGDSIAVKKPLADELARTGRENRDLKNWANVYEVNVDGVLCELTYTDKGGISLMRGTNF